MGTLKKRCKTHGCRNFHHNESGYCDECTAKYLALHPKRGDNDRPSASKRGYGWKWQKFSKDFLKLHPTCAICGAPAKCVDHRDIPADVMMDAYGSFDYDPSHYQALCYKCNASKGKREDKHLKEKYYSQIADINNVINDTQREGSEKLPLPPDRIRLGLSHTQNKCSDFRIAEKKEKL